MAPKVLGDRFELLSQAAAGGMGSVWRARDLNTSNTVAVKILALDRPFDLVRFERESQLLAQLHHSNVVAYVAHGVSDKIHYLVQEWVDGITLAIQEQTIGITAAEAVTLGIGIADALGAAHSLGIVHRDVKPANVILDGGEIDRIKLVDFGIARLASDAGVLTRTGVLIGTPSYMAPEQARGSIEISPAADVWSLGCVLYEMLTGRKAFGGKTPEAVRAQVLLAPVEPLHGLCPEAPQPLVQLINAMLAKHLAHRPASGVEAAAMLRALPPTPEGPRRRVGVAQPQPPTAIMPVRKKKSEPTPAPAPDEGAANCFIYFTAAPADEYAAPPPVEQVKRISDKYELGLHELEDGSVIMHSAKAGPAGALAAARAAMELREELGGGAISVFGQAVDETIADALDRGGERQAQLAMESLFADALDRENPIHIDGAIAELIGAELAIEQTDVGMVLPHRARTA